jgi:hypothetical protein
MSRKDSGLMSKVLQMLVFSEDYWIDDANGVMVYRSLWYF